MISDLDISLPAIKTLILKLPKEEQDYEIAYWSLKYLDDYRWRPDPTAPQKFLDYLALPIEQRRRMNKSPQDYMSLWDETSVRTFLSDKGIIRSLNYRNRKWLEDIKLILEAKGGHEKDISKIELMLYKYKDNNGGELTQPDWSKQEDEK